MLFARCLTIALAIGLTVSVISCSSSSEISLDYNPQPGRIVRGKPEFATSSFVDRRNQEPNYVGNVRTQIGTPLEYIYTRVPVAQVTTNAFAHGLQARGMLTNTGAARYLIRGEVQELYCQMLVRPYAYARVRVSVMEAGSGQVLFSSVFTGERQSPAYVPGSGSPVPMLRDLTSRALQDVVDKALDSPQLRSQLGLDGGNFGPAPRYVPGML